VLSQSIMKKNLASLAHMNSLLLSYKLIVRVEIRCDKLCNSSSVPMCCANE